MVSNLPNSKGKNKYFVPSNTEWFNSVYFYNTNNIKSLPILDKISYRLIKMYFNVYNTNMESKVELWRFTKRKRWLSTRKIWINKLELKHTNDKLIINVHIYDRIYNTLLRKFNMYMWNISYPLWHDTYLYKLKKTLPVFFDLQDNIRNLSTLLSSYIFKKINNESLDILDINELRSLKEKYDIKNDIKQYNKLLFIQLLKKKEKLFNEKLGKKIILLRYNEFFKNYVLKYRKELIVTLQRIINKIYNKKIIFNIIFLKNYYLNSEILTQILTHKTRDRDNKAYRTMKKTLTNIKIPIFRKNIINKAKKHRYSENIILKHNYNKKIDSIIKSYFDVSNVNYVLNKLNNKTIIGVRIESAGRLTRRFTAQRAVKKYKYIGTIRNVDSSLKGLSTQIVRNNISSSLQYSKGKSQNRIGSFGIKGWINSV